jgi:Zn-dependent metalloprotease
MICSGLQAQTRDTVELDRNEQKILRYARFKPGNQERKMLSAVPFLQKALEAKNGETFVLISSKTDDLGITHNKYQQVFEGIPLEGVQYLVHGRGDDIETINGQFVSVSLASVTPQLNSKKALEKALSYVNAKKYAWEDQVMEAMRKQEPYKGKSTFKPEAELVITQDRQSGSNDWRLAYKFQIFSVDPIKDLHVYIDANNGTLLNMISLVCHGNTPGTAHTLYNGTQNITGDSYLGQYRLREVRNSVDIVTVNAGNTNNLNSNTDFVDNDNNWTLAEHFPYNYRAALDVHWSMEMTLDYFRTVHSRNSYDNLLGLKAKSLVNFNFSNDPNNPDHNNAAWYSSAGVFTFGDGNGTPWTTLDIVAHEFGHAINDYEANLVYERESGALDEGFSDIWGAVVESWAAPGKNPWLLGEDRGAIRSMSNPNLYFQPDTYGGNNWASVINCTPNIFNDYCGVHTNSGVLNFCFYLMSQGGTGTNDNGQGYSVTGVGIAKAARIAYRALVNYLTPNSTFADARNAFISAAFDLYGTCSVELVATTNAWHAVGVGAAFVHPTFQIQHEYIPESCNNVNVWAYLVNSPITWHTSSSLLVNGYPSPYTTSASNAVITNSGSSYGQVYATYTSGGCNYTSEIVPICPCTNWSNANFRILWSNPTPGEPVLAEVDPHPDAIGYNWYYDGQLVETMGGSMFGYYDWDCGVHGIGVVALFACGSSTMVGDSFEGLCFFRAASDAKLYPNPATNSVTIELNNQKAGTTSSTLQKTSALNGINQIRIFDKLGVVRIQKSFTGQVERCVIDLSVLQTDIYFVEIFDGRNRKRFPLMVRRK